MHKLNRWFTAVVVTAAMISGSKIKVEAGTLEVPANYPTIQSAINAAVPGVDDVLVYSGVYIENITINKDITVWSAYGAGATTISASNSSLSTVVFDGLSSAGGIPNSRLIGFTVTGAGPGSNGGIFCDNASPTIFNCVITGNTEIDNGGGVGVLSGAPTIYGCDISGNSADYGAGIYAEKSSPTIMNNNIFSNVTTYSYVGSGEPVGGRGGGIYLSTYGVNTFPILQNNDIRGNVADFSGGGILINGAIGASVNPKIVNCNITGNKTLYSENGGGISSTGGSPLIINSTISENLAYDYMVSAPRNGGAGGIDYQCDGSSTLLVVNSIVRGNAVGALTDATTSMYVYGSCLSGSPGYSGAGGYPAGMGVDLNYSDIHGIWPGTGLIDDDPSFVGGGDYHLNSDSPCIDQGTSDTGIYSDLPSYDIDNNSRPQGLSHDMGSDEYCTDGDGDGYYDALGCGTALDCDDADPDKYPGNPEVCDNKDNNCNGSTDENLTRPTSCGVGECAGNAGQETCSGGSWGGDTCDPLAGASAEVCDNLDNNCDGATDENLTRPTSCGVGECAGNTGEETCSVGGWGGDTCDPLAGASAEVCDNLDNNCDGATDEDLTRPTSCGVGECAGNTGEETCSGGGWGGDTCDPLAGSSAEVCDNLDNNCDGATDENLTQPTSCGVGECAGNTGEETCSGGGWGGDTCDPLGGATSEVCGDGLDNNCDGQTDEGCSTCTDGDGDGYYAEDGCGTEIDCNDSNQDINPGACDIKRNGIDEDCDGSDRRKGPACPPPSGGDPEICDDSIDNDGDGDVDCDDSDCIGDPACGSSCTPSPEICDDGVDNDCDGKVDCSDKKDCRTDPAC